jgi:hypothetical protein
MRSLAGEICWETATWKTHERDGKKMLSWMLGKYVLRMGSGWN